ncbi:MAG: hypothetical protein HQ482_04500 [Sphingomonadales bacterium]|nr:hypothetical protein [Sphingomonadales bacterium]
MLESKEPVRNDHIITNFAPIFRKKLERLEQRGLNESTEAISLRRALQRIAQTQS